MEAPSFRSRLAARTPGPVRKAVRMAEHYVRRHKEWFDVMHEMRGVRGSDKLQLGVSCLFAPLTSLRRLDGFEAPHHFSDIEVEARGVGRFTLRSGTDDIIHVLSAREPHVRAAIEKRLKPGDNFVDAGANIGFYSVLASRIVGDDGTVISVEMMPETSARLQHHFAINGCTNTRIVERALSNRNGDVVRATSSDMKFGQASITPASSQGRSIVHEVETITLDRVLAELDSVAVMKMDLEGAESLAISGARDALDKIRAIIFENNARNSHVPDLLASRGFMIQHLGGNDFCAEKPAPTVEPQ